MGQAAGGDFTDSLRLHIMNNTFGACPVLQVIVNNQSMNSLLDTGAEVSTITQSFCDQFLSNASIIDTTSWMTITAANNLGIPYKGYIELDLQIMGKVYSGAGFLVVKDPDGIEAKKKKTKTPGIIGCNILHMVHRSVIAQYGENYPDALKSHPDGNVWSKVLTLFDTPGLEKDISTQPMVSAVRVASKQPVKIPAKTAVVIDGTAGPGIHAHVNLLVEPMENSQLPANIAVIPTCTSNNSGIVPIRVLNIGDEDKWLQPRSRIGMLQQVKMVQSSSAATIHDVGISEIQVQLDITGNGDFAQQTISDINSEDIQQNKVSTNSSINDPLFEMIGDLGLENLTPEQQTEFLTLLHANRDVFSLSDDDLGFTQTVKYSIPTIDDTPVCLRPHRLHPNHRQEVKAQIEKWLRQGVIRHSTSPYAAPTVVVRKSDGSIRLCCDFRQLNAKTRKDAFPLPRIEEALDSLKGAKFFTSLDLVQGYLQCAMDEKDIHKTAFRPGCGGLYEFLRMPFGLCNAPSSFQRLMEACLGDQNFETLLIYLDDILAYACSYDSHISRILLIFQLLRQHGLKLKPGKCRFFQKRVKYLGHIVSEKGVEADPGKIEVVQQWPVPRSEKNLRAFLGLVGYYRRFIEGFAKIAKPLHALLGGARKSEKNKVKQPVHISSQAFAEKWDTECLRAFQRLKSCLITAPVLGYPDFSKPFIVETDACSDGLGAVLSQDQEQGRVVVSYASCSLRPTERNMNNYSAMKLELLALKWAVTEKFRDYLLGSQCVCYTDNNPLCYIKTAKLGATEMNWVAQLAQFDLDV